MSQNFQSIYYVLLIIWTLSLSVHPKSILDALDILIFLLINFMLILEVIFDYFIIPY